MRYKIKGQQPLSLFDLLKKRKITLSKFTKDFGITAYVTLANKCESIGVTPPTEEQFHAALGGVFSSPQEGIVVLDPPSLTKDDGQKIAVDEFLHQEVPQVEVEVASTSSEEENQTTYQYRKKKRKQDTENLE